MSEYKEDKTEHFLETGENSTTDKTFCNEMVVQYIAAYWNPSVDPL